VADPALMKIDPYPWSAPLEDVRLKQVGLTRAKAGNPSIAIAGRSAAQPIL
jgi:hypothetical protein